VSAGVHGDWAGFDALKRKLQHIGDARAEAIERIGHVVERNVAMGFNRSYAPDGTPWLPLAQPRSRARRGVPRDAVGRFAASRGPRPGRPLIDTRALFLSVQGTQPRTNGFVIETTLPYAATHQYGRGRIPARPFLPMDGLPIAWEIAFREAVNTVMAQHFE